MVHYSYNWLLYDLHFWLFNLLFLSILCYLLNSYRIYFIYPKPILLKFLISLTPKLVGVGRQIMLSPNKVCYLYCIFFVWSISLRCYLFPSFINLKVILDDLRIITWINYKLECCRLLMFFNNLVHNKMKI